MGLKRIKNWMLVHFYIRPFLDHEFNLLEFMQGATQAMQVVSCCMAVGDLKNLERLVSPEALNDLKRATARKSVGQRFKLLLSREDIYCAFPYDIEVIYDGGKRFVQIEMVFHVVRGLKGMIERGESIPLFLTVDPKYKDQIIIGNYRFIKEFTKGVESDWTVNRVGHFDPND